MFAQLLAVRHTWRFWRSLHRPSGPCRSDFVLAAFPRARAVAASFLVIFSTLFAIYGLLAGLGTHSGITRLHFHLPLLNRIREAGRHLHLVYYICSLLTGLGFDTCAPRIFGFAIRRDWSCNCRQRPVDRRVLVIAYRSHTWNWLPLCVIPVGLVILYLARIGITALVATGLSFSCLAAAIAHNGTTPSYYWQAIMISENLTALRVIQGLTNLPGIYTSRVAFRDSASARPLGDGCELLWDQELLYEHDSGHSPISSRDMIRESPSPTTGS